MLPQARLARIDSGLFAGEALERLLEYPDIETVLDIGSGDGRHAEVMRAEGCQVTTIGLQPPADFVGDYLDYPGEPVDAIWASHVLEHQRDVGQFLRKCFSDLKSDGVLVVTVPPLKHQVVGGHVNLFNQGTLLYNLILAGFDCSEARVSPCYVGGVPFPYNLSVIVRKRKAVLPDDLTMDHGDIEKLAKFFPFPVHEEFNGNLSQGVNW